MEMHERIKELRKKHLKMSQEAFGEHLGVSRDIIGNIELNRLARPDQKLSLVKLMCKEFGINEEWILNGTEPMLVEPDTFNLDDLIKKHGASDLELEVLKAYFELDPAIRKSVVEHFKSRLAVNAVAQVQEDSFYIPDTPEEFEKLYPPIEPPNKDIWVG